MAGPAGPETTPKATLADARVVAQVVALGECMVELALNGAATALVAYAGDTFNTAVYLRRLGRKVAYGTALGRGDPFSAAILDKMDEEGLSRALVVEAQNRLPGLYAISRDASGERSFYYWRGEAPAREYWDLVDLEQARAALMGAELVYVSAISLAVIGEKGRAILIPLLREAAEQGVAIALDSNYRARLWPDPAIARAAIRAVAQACRYVSLSDEDVAGFDGGDPEALARDWAARGAEVVLRRQDRAVQVLTKDSAESFRPPSPVAVVDTTGAGDAFNAGYLAARLAGRPPREAVAVARRLAGVVVQHPGAIIPVAAMPDLQDARDERV
jgi:2-dehydro-3-deoxygluconokinase